MHRLSNLGLRQARRVIVGVVGITLLLIGVALIALPGPAMLVIPLGLAILATEFLWARRLLSNVRRRAGMMHQAAKRRWSRQVLDAAPRIDRRESGVKM